MIASARSGSILASELKSNGFDCESAHLVVEAEGIDARRMWSDSVVTLFLSFEEKFLPNHLALVFGLKNANQRRGLNKSNLSVTSDP